MGKIQDYKLRFNTCKALIKLAFLALVNPSVTFSMVYFASVLVEYESLDDDVKNQIVNIVKKRVA